MDHYGGVAGGVAGWKTGLQGEAVYTGLGPDPGYHLVTPSPLLDTASSHPYAPRYC